MPARLTQASVTLLVMPAYVLVDHGLRALRGHATEPLIVVALIYVLIAAVLAAGVLKRSRVAWVGAIVLSAATTIAALYLGWHFGHFLFTGAARVGSALVELSLFHVVFVVSSVGALTLLLSGQARRELRGP